MARKTNLILRQLLESKQWFEVLSRGENINFIQLRCIMQMGCTLREKNFMKHYKTKIRNLIQMHLCKGQNTHINVQDQLMKDK